MELVKKADPLYTAWDVEFDEDFFVIVRPGEGEEALQVYAPKSKKQRERIVALISNAPKLLLAAETILADLNNRIRLSGERRQPVPVFNGIADLHEAIILCAGKEIE